MAKQMTKGEAKIKVLLMFKEAHEKFGPDFPSGPLLKEIKDAGLPVSDSSFYRWLESARGGDFGGAEPRKRKRSEHAATKRKRKQVKPVVEAEADQPIVRADGGIDYVGELKDVLQQANRLADFFGEFVGDKGKQRPRSPKFWLLGLRMKTTALATAGKIQADLMMQDRVRDMHRQIFDVIAREAPAEVTEKILDEVRKMARQWGGDEASYM